MKLHALTLSIAGLLLASGPAAAQTTAALTNGPGDCSVRVTVDGYGSFGSAATPMTDLMFDPLGATGPFGTTFQAAVLFVPGCGSARWLTIDPGFGTPALPPVVVTGGGLSASSSGNIPATGSGFDFTLTQTLNSPVDGDCGSTLVQRYVFTNRTGAACDVCVIRAADFDVRGSFSNDRSGTSVAAPGGPGNNHWIFEFDDADSMTGPLVAISAEGTDHLGGKALSGGFRSGTYPFFPSLQSGGCSALTNTILNDTNGDLVCLAPELAADNVVATGVRFLGVPDGARFTFVTRTRLTTKPALTGRDIVPLTEAGNVGTDVLSVNGGSGGPGRCVAAAGPVAIGMAAPPGNPATHYLLYVLPGKPLLGGLCGGAIAMDYATWSIPGYGTLGDGSFNVAGFPVSGSGGGSTPGVGLFSSIPGLAPLTTAAASGPFPGAPILPPLLLPPGLSVTLQGIIVDLAGGVAIKVTNSVEVASAPCACQP